MRKITQYLGVAVVVSALLWLTACERRLSGAEEAGVLMFSEAATDNVLAGWSTNDYAMFSRDFDADLQADLPAADFTALKQELDSSLGNYISRTVEQATQADEFYVVTYRARFEKDDAVAVSVAFHISNKAIATLGFESDTVSWSAFQRTR